MHDSGISLCGNEVVMDCPGSRYSMYREKSGNSRKWGAYRKQFHLMKSLGFVVVQTRTVRGKESNETSPGSTDTTFKYANLTVSLGR